MAAHIEHVKAPMILIESKHVKDITPDPLTRQKPPGHIYEIKIRGTRG